MNRYGIIHSQFGTIDGVSIVMRQVEHAMTEFLGIPIENIFYFTGKDEFGDDNITEDTRASIYDPVNQKMMDMYRKGYDEETVNEIEKKVHEVEASLNKWINENKIDKIIMHNGSHPVNFILSLALSRYYRNAEGKTPKYILWWHDSHLERDHFLNPAEDVEKYLLEGVPGRSVEYIVFINSLQFDIAKGYFQKMDDQKYIENLKENHGVIYNTADDYIDSYKDIYSKNNGERVKVFLRDFGINEILEEHSLELDEMVFCLQHTRIVHRKRIDFAIRYNFELLKRMRESGDEKALYFLVSGNRSDSSKEEIIEFHRKLCEEKEEDKFFLAFAEDFEGMTIDFIEFPIIFAKLGGFSTFFSDIEGFGNNLLEMMASGLIPVIYTYPVYVNDIAQFDFRLVSVDRFEVSDESIEQMIGIIRDEEKRERWVDENLEKLRKNLSHEQMASKVKKAFESPRLHE